MTDTAAPATLAFRRRSTLERLVLDPDLEIGAGGEAVVYGVPGDGSLVAKVYHRPTIERARKLAAMLDHPPAMPEGTATAWPVDLLLDAGGRFAGFVMPRAEGPRLFEFYNPVSRRGAAPGFHAGLLHRAGRNLAAAFDALHAAGYVVGDVNESNLLVSPADAAVALVDADSLQVRDPASDALFRSRVGKAEFTPPELQGVSFEEVDRVEAHDRFGLAVLLYLLLMEGTHPFATRMDGDGEALPVEARIRRCHFPHASPDDDCHPPRLSPRFDALHPPLQALFLRAFVDGHADPAARPSPAEWRDALGEAEAALAVCAANPLHRHPSHLAACPWCARAALLGGRDPFPPAGTAVARAPRPPRPRRVAAPLAPASGPMPGTGPAPTRHRPRQVLQHYAPHAPAPAVFGRSGLPNPITALIPAAVLMMHGGTLGLFAAVAAVVALVALVRNGGRDIRVSTVVVAVALAAVLSAVAGLASNADAPSPPVFPVGSAPPLPAPAPVRAVDDFMVPEIESVPVSRAPSALPPEPGPPASGGEHGYDAPDVDRLPLLENPVEAARVLATTFAGVHVPRDRPDTAVLWVRVGRDGRATGNQVVFSTSGAVAAAAVATLPYLRYVPGAKEGRVVPTWISQRMIVVP
ncbi:MAG: hypothetical protein ACJ8GN_25135 [Longimicrobiaceae bacterium]